MAVVMAEVVMAESGIAIAANKASAQKIKQREYYTKWYRKQTRSQMSEINKKKYKNRKLNMSKKRKHTDDMTKAGTDDVEGMRLKHADNKVDLTTAVEKVDKMSNEDDGLREEDMKVVDVGAANEVIVIGTGDDTDVVGNTTMSRNDSRGVTSEYASSHNNGTVWDGTVNNNSSSENSSRRSRRITNRNNNDGMTSVNAASHNNGVVREAAVNDNSSHDSRRRNREVVS